MIRIKVCGVTTVDDAVMCAEEGVDYIGLNFVRTSPRFIERVAAAEIVSVVGARFPAVTFVGVVANETAWALESLRRATWLSWLQCHGDESPQYVAAAQPYVVKAVRIGDANDAARAREYAGDWILADSRVPGSLGGSGVAFDWSLVSDLCRARSVMLAGGLGPDNVGDAVRAVRPFAVDVASGVEEGANARQKSRDKVRAFVAAARDA